MDKLFQPFRGKTDFSYLSSFLGLGDACELETVKREVLPPPLRTAQSQNFPRGSRFSIWQLLSADKKFRAKAVVRTYSGPVTMEVLPTQDPV